MLEALLVLFPSLTLSTNVTQIDVPSAISFLFSLRNEDSGFGASVGAPSDVFSTKCVTSLHLLSRAHAANNHAGVSLLSLVALHAFESPQCGAQ